MQINYTKLKIGDRLVREKGGVLTKHHVLYAGIDSQTGERIVAENQRGFGVRIITLRQFLNEGKLIRVEYNHFSQYCQGVIIKRIKARLGWAYDLLTYNCEQFVNDVLNGVAKSKQVQNGVKVALGSAAFLLFIGFFGK